MVKLSEQSDICKKHFSAGAIVSAAIYKTEYRRLTTKKDISNEELKKIFFDGVERDLLQLKIVKTEEIGFDEAEKWIADVKEIIVLSDAFEEAYG